MTHFLCSAHGPSITSGSGTRPDSPVTPSSWKEGLKLVGQRLILTHAFLTARDAAGGVLVTPQARADVVAESALYALFVNLGRLVGSRKNPGQPDVAESARAHRKWRQRRESPNVPYLALASASEL